MMTTNSITAAVASFGLDSETTWTVVGVTNSKLVVFRVVGEYCNVVNVRRVDMCRHIDYICVIDKVI